MKSRSQGYQIGLNEDGISVLKSLDIPHLEELLSLNDKDGFKIVDANLKLLFHVKTALKGGALVNRWKLRELLTQGLDIQWNKKFVKYEEFPDHVVAHFEDGTTAKADVLIGVDGAKSRVRAQRCPQLSYESVGIIGGGGYLPMPSRELAPNMVELAENSMVRAVTRTGVTLLFFTFKNYEDEQFMLWTISRNKISANEELPKDPKLFKETLLEMSKHIHPELYKLVELTPEETMLPAVNMYAMKVPSKKDIMGKTGRVVLMGDAAHAMTTHAGLGANTALLDAKDLAEALSADYDNWRTRLAKYEKKV
jgi:salicylate hydroxylase